VKFSRRCILLGWTCFQLLTLHGQNIIPHLNLSDSNLTWTRGKFFDFFRGQYDSVFTTIGGLEIIPFDSISRDVNTIRYDFRQTKDSLIVSYRNETLFSYKYNSKGQICVGILYYPFNRNIAIWGQFKESRLHGIVTTFLKNGTLLEVMMYKRGAYKYHMYRRGMPCMDRTKLFLKSETTNPLRMDELIIQ